MGSNPTEGMDIGLLCMLSGRGLCDELITRPEESYRLWCVVVCDLENLKNEETMTRVGSQRHRNKKKSCISLVDFIITISDILLTSLFNDALSTKWVI